MMRNKKSSEFKESTTFNSTPPLYSTLLYSSLFPSVCFASVTHMFSSEDFFVMILLGAGYLISTVLQSSDPGVGVGASVGVGVDVGVSVGRKSELVGLKMSVGVGVSHMHDSAD
jgi:hypothetical protein